MKHMGLRLIGILECDLDRFVYENLIMLGNFIANYLIAGNKKCHGTFFNRPYLFDFNAD